MKRYLRAYVHHQQDDWADWLFMTKYAFNAFISIITQMSSFFINYNFESRMSFDHVSLNKNTDKERVQRIENKEIVFIMKKIWKFVKAHMKKSQQNQVTQINKHRTIVSEYQIKNQVWLSIKDIQIDRFSRKLNHKMLKSFKILKKRESSYKLDLSNEMNIHSMFHTSLLRKNLENSLLEQIISSSSSVVIDDEQKFDVKDIIDSRLTKRSINKKLQYKIRWVKHSSNRKWYSIKNFENAKKIVADYYQRYLDKSKSQFLIIQSLIISLMTHLTNSFSWARKNIQKTKIMIENILNKMKKEMKFDIIKQTSIANVERNNTTTKTANQDCLVTKTINVERILSNQNWEKSSVTISCQSCQSSNQMISIKRINKRE
jgi:Zn finger protein HypA/HybF involved in hydrogenase expression